MINIGIVKDDVVYLASNSGYYTLPTACYMDTNMPCYAIDKVPNAIASYSGIIIEGQIFRFATKLISLNKLKDGKLTKNHVVNYTLKNMIEGLYKRNILEEDEKMNGFQGSFLIAKDDRLFEISRDLDVRSIHSFIAVNEVLDFECLTYLAEFKNEDVIYQILKTFNIKLSKSDVGTYPIIIRSTKEPRKPLVFSLEQTLKYIKDYEAKKESELCY